MFHFFPRRVSIRDAIAAGGVRWPYVGWNKKEMALLFIATLVSLTSEVCWDKSQQAISRKSESLWDSHIRKAWHV